MSTSQAHDDAHDRVERPVVTPPGERPGSATTGRTLWGGWWLPVESAGTGH